MTMSHKPELFANLSMHLQTLAYEMNRIRSHPLKGRVV